MLYRANITGGMRNSCVALRSFTTQGEPQILCFHGITSFADGKNMTHPVVLLVLKVIWQPRIADAEQGLMQIRTHESVYMTPTKTYLWSSSCVENHPFYNYL